MGIYEVLVEEQRFTTRRVVLQWKKHPPLLVIVRAAGEPGFHPRPVTERYVPQQGEVISWWELCGIGWYEIREAALAAGLAQVDLVNPKGTVVAWQVSEAGLSGTRWRQIEEEDGVEAVLRDRPAVRVRDCARPRTGRPHAAARSRGRSSPPGAAVAGQRNRLSGSGRVPVI